MAKKALIAGVGMTPFTKPGQSEDWDVMAEAAVRMALKDAGLDYADVQQVYAGHVFGDSTCGQSAVYRVGVTGVPIINVHNNCSTGSTALFMARQAVEAGVADCILALGFEQMTPGALGFTPDGRKPPLERHLRVQEDLHGLDEAAPIAAQQFGGVAVEYKNRFGTRDETFAQIAVKARSHAANNALAVFREPLSLEEVMQAKPIFGPLTRYQACPPTCGAAAAIVVSPVLARRRGLSGCVEIKAQALTTDFPSSFDPPSMIKVVGYDLTRHAAQQVFEEASVGPGEVQVVELHDCFTPNELITYEALGLCAEGGAEQFIWDGDNTYGGQYVVNPSGGLLSRGHPLGATGLAQCFELTRQVRGLAGATQVEGVRFALQQNMGLGSACVVTLYGRA